jgi:multiple sugar transport system permease protein
VTRPYRRIPIGSYLFLAPYAASFAAFIVLPFLVALVLSFLQFDLTSQEAVRFVGLSNFSDALQDAYFWKAVKATFSFVVLMVPLMLLLSTVLALGLYAMGRGRNVVRALLFLPGMLNVAVAAILWQWFFTDTFGLFNFLLRELGFEHGLPWITSRHLAMPSIVFMSLWWSVGGSTIIMLAGLQQIPDQLFEAAAIDGANRWQTFRAITLPMLRPVLLFLTIINTIGAFQVFAQPFLITGGGPELATRGVVQYIYETAFQNYRLGYGAAMSWLLFALIAVFSLLQYRALRGASS